MRNVLVDVHRLGGNTYNGLYHFCYQLGLQLVQQAPASLSLSYYMPQRSFGILGNAITYAAQKSVHKYYHANTKKYDVWHAATTLSWYKPYNSSTKYIFTIHDLNFMHEVEYSENSKRKYLQLIQLRVNRAQHLTYISHFAHTQAQQYLQLGNIPYSIIYNGCNILLPQYAITPRQLPATPFLFALGQMHSRKNFAVLPALLQHNQLQLILAGDCNTAYAQQIIAAAKQLGVANRVHLVGVITESEKIWYYQHCQAFVFPSIGEGFGLPVLEAMQFGKPVFLSMHTSLPEVGGSAAYYFNSFEPEAMQHAYQKGMQHYNITQPHETIKAQAAKFSYVTAAHQYLQLYQNV